MEEIPTALELEQVAQQMPAEITLSRQQQDRCYLDGGWVVASGSILAPEGSVVAIKPFPKSKTGFTIEFCFERSLPPKPCRTTDSNDYRTRTFRTTFLDWKGVILKPHYFTDYRGKKVMGMLCGTLVSDQARLWLLQYTLFLAPKKPPKR